MRVFASIGLFALLGLAACGDDDFGRDLGIDFHFTGDGGEDGGDEDLSRPIVPTDGGEDDLSAVADAAGSD